MILDLDIYRAANLLIKQHGTDAELIAAQRADLMGRRWWECRWIARAIVELQAPPTGKPH